MKSILLFVTATLFFASANGQYKILDMNAPQAKKYLKTQLDRMDEVRKHKYAGHVGESDNALLAIHDLTGLSKADQDKIKKMVDAENKDRQAIYQAIAAHNKLNAQDKIIFLRSAYETYRNTEAKGNYYFENKKWQKKY